MVIGQEHAEGGDGFVDPWRGGVGNEPSSANEKNAY